MHLSAIGSEMERTATPNYEESNFPRGLGPVVSRQLYPSIEGAHYKDLAIVTFECHKF